jgi:hypothetical protein
MFGMIEMIFILHDERTARFKARYNQERAGMAAPDGYAAYPGSYAAAPDAYAGMPDAYADVPGGYGDAPADYSYTDNLYDDLPENFPVNGISEEGIFENSGYGDSSTPPAGGAFYQGQDLDRRR